MAGNEKIYAFFGNQNVFNFVFANHLLLFYWGFLRLQTLLSDLKILQDDDPALFLAQTVEALLVVNLIFGIVILFLKQPKLRLVVGPFFASNRHSLNCQIYTFSDLYLF